MLESPWSLALLHSAPMSTGGDVYSGQRLEREKNGIPRSGIL